MEAEYEKIKASQVSAVMITNDTDTIAGTAEAPIRAALAAVATWAWHNQTAA